MKIAIIGSGPTGLTAAYRLTKLKHQVTVFEKESFPGGLAASFTRHGWKWSLEKYFHHFFTSDLALLKLSNELSLNSRIVYYKPKTSLYCQGKIYQFDSPLKVLAFPLLSLPERIRTGIVTAWLKVLNNPKSFSKVTAYKWLSFYYGKKAFSLLWQPLLDGKFGVNAKEVAMVWFWGRIKKRSLALGYFKGGFSLLSTKLIQETKRMGGKFYFNKTIDNLDSLTEKYDRVLFTGPAKELLSLSKKWPKDYKNRLKSLSMLGALNLVLVLEKRFFNDKTYWLNVNEKGFPFIAVVEHTNFIDPKYYAGEHLLYVGGYYPTNHPYFKMSKEQIWQVFKPYLEKINSNIKVKEIYLFKSLFAQPLVTIGYERSMPHFQTPLPKVFLADMQMVYPWDRGINYAINLGEEVAKKINVA